MKVFANKVWNRILAVALAMLMFVGVFSFGDLSKRTVHAADGTYNLVTDASTLAAGDQVVIVAAGSDYAMSTTQNDNNRGQAAVTKNTDNTVTLTADVQELTLEEGAIDGTFAFNTGSGYLYAASSNKNYLRTETTLSNNSSWTIEIGENDIATVKAQGTNTHNWMRYNSSNNPPIFSCYGSGQADIVLYKFKASTACEHEGGTGTETTPATCTQEGEMTYDVCTNCGESYTKPIEKIAHDMQTVAAEPATCIKIGWNEYSACSQCDYKENYTELSATGVHTYVGGVCSGCGSAEPQTETFKKVTTALADWSGTYLIVYEDGTTASVFDGSLTTLDKVSNIVTKTISDDSIETEATYAFTIAAVEGGYSIQSASKQYIGQTSNDNGLATGESVLVNTISLDSDVVNIISGGAYLRYNSASNQLRFRYYKSSSYTNQKSIALYRLDDGSVACTHEGVEWSVKESATCTEDGVETFTCTCGYATTREIPATGHTFENNVCTVCGKEETTFAMVLNANSLQVGDKIIIAAAEADYALSTTQKTNNRGQIAITKNGGVIIPNTDDVQILTLEKGAIDGTFAFNTGSGYLYAASSSENYLRTEKDSSNNSSWTIEIDENGIATVKAQGDCTHNWLQYNKSGLFSCYENGQTDIVLYKKNEKVATATKDFAELTTGRGFAFSYNEDNTVNDSCLRFYMSIDDDLYEALKAKGGTFGVYAICTREDGKSSEVHWSQADKQPVFIEVDGTYYFALCFNNLTKYYNASFQGQIYVEIDGVKYYMQASNANTVAEDVTDTAADYGANEKSALEGLAPQEV